MNIASLALASALAAAIGCAQPAMAQSQDQTGATANQNGSRIRGYMNGPMMNHGSMMNGTDQNESTTGANARDRAMNERTDDDSDNGGGNWNWHHRRRWSDVGPMRGQMGPMWGRRMMMRAMGGARFHFARGNARIDVRCPPDEDVRACVKAAGELLDKIAELHNGGRGNTTGSATGEENGETNGSALSPNRQQNPRGEPNLQNQAAPGATGERM
jgi:hypothetical protein